MEINEFAANCPELFNIFTNDVRFMISENQLNGDMSLRDWDDMIDDMKGHYERKDFFGFNMDGMTTQQITPFDRRNMDRRDRFRRRRFRDFDIRDILRLLFLRELFDRDHRR